jgi:hypothetical protein
VALTAGARCWSRRSPPHLLALDRVAAHPFALVLVERPRPVADVGIDGELADVVEHGHELDLGGVERIGVHALGQGPRAASLWL